MQSLEISSKNLAKMKKLLIATSNKGKLDGLSYELLSLPLNIVSLQNYLVDDSTLIESGNTFEENAKIKARFYAEKIKLMTLADDSGLIVEALKDELGVKTRRWGAGEKASDKEWLDFFLKRMEKEKNRKALFVSCICLVDNQGKIICTARGETYGTLAREIQAPIKPGIPLSSIFIPDGCDKVHSAMSVEEKNKISHRGKAMRVIKAFLEEYLSS